MNCFITLLRTVLFCSLIHFINGLSIQIIGMAYDKVTTKPNGFNSYSAIDYYYIDGEAISWICDKIIPNTAGIVHWQWECRSGCLQKLNLKLSANNDGNELFCVLNDKGHQEYIEITLHLINEFDVSGVRTETNQLQKIHRNEYVYYYNSKEYINWSCYKTNPNTSSEVYWECKKCYSYFIQHQTKNLYATLLASDNGKVIECVHDKGNGIQESIKYTLMLITTAQTPPTQFTTMQPTYTPTPPSTPPLPPISTALATSKKHDATPRSYKFDFVGLDTNRFKAIDNSNNIFIYYFNNGEDLTLKCQAVDMTHDRSLKKLKWKYSSGLNVQNISSGIDSILKVKLNEINNNTELFCTDSDTQARGTLKLQLNNNAMQTTYTPTPTSTPPLPPICNNPEINVPVYGCPEYVENNKLFFITGIPNNLTPIFKGTKLCNGTLEYKEPLSLKLRCYRFIKKKTPNTYGPLQWRFGDSVVAEQPFDGCKASLEHTFSITETNDKQEISCEIKQKITKEILQIRLLLAYIPPTPAPISVIPENSNEVVSKIVDSPFLKRRHKRAPYDLRRTSKNSEEDTEGNAKEIKFSMTINNKKTYQCDVKYKEVVLMEGEPLRIIVTSKKFVNYFWCFSENDKYTNIMSNINTIEGIKHGSEYIKQINVTKAMEGQWNCTFLGTPVKNYQLRYTFNKNPYLWANCSLKLSVKLKQLSSTSSGHVTSAPTMETNFDRSSKTDDSSDGIMDGDNEISFRVDIKNKTYTCEVKPQNKHLTEGEVLTIKVKSKKYINYLWCFSENDTYTNIIKDIKNDDSEQPLFNYIKYVNVTTSLEGKWNCTFLGFLFPPDSWEHKYMYKDKHKGEAFTYLRTNCSLNINVEPHPKTTATMSTIFSSTASIAISSEATSIRTISTSSTNPSTVSTTDTFTTSILTSTFPTTSITSKVAIESRNGKCYGNNCSRKKNQNKRKGNNSDGNKRTNGRPVKYLITTSATKATPTKKTTLSSISKLPYSLSSLPTTTYKTKPTSPGQENTIRGESTISQTINSITTLDQSAIAGKMAPGSNSAEANIDNDNPKGAGNLLMPLSYGVSGVACFIILVMLICVVHKHVKRNKKIKRSTSEVTYENLGSDVNRQFPPNLEALYAKPYDNHSIEEESPYAVSSYQETDTYSVPYVETDVNKLYAKPVPKKYRKEQMYTKVLPKSQRKPAEKEIVYAQIETSSSKREGPKATEATYSEIIPENYATANTGYENVFNNRQRYANTKNSEYAEPAYCELNR